MNTDNPPPPELEHEKKIELADMFEASARRLSHELPLSALRDDRLIEFSRDAGGTQQLYDADQMHRLYPWWSSDSIDE